MIELKRILVVREQTEEERATPGCAGCALIEHEDCTFIDCGTVHQVMQIKEIVCLS